MLSFIFVMLAATIATPKGDIVNLRVVRTLEAQTKGLSGVKEIKDNEGMLFYYTRNDYRTFWMYNTFINLDIFFLDENFVIKSISRNMKKSPTLDRINVETTPSVNCRHVLEMDTNSKISASLKVNDKLIWSD